MRRGPILIVLLLAGCSNCGGGNNTNARANNTTPDAGSNNDVGPDNLQPNNTPTALNFERRVPLETITENRLEDPNFGFQNESWFAVDNTDELQRVRRIYDPHSPEDRPVAGIVGGNGTTCLLGRMLWGEDDHLASVWIGRAEGDDSGEVEVALLGIKPTPEPSWTTASLTRTADTVDFEDGRTWARYETSALSRFGWGYFEVCTNAADTVFVGAPSVVEGDTSNALVVGVEPPKATARQLRRIKAFERWRTRQ